MRHHTPGPWAVSHETFDNDGYPETVITGLDARAAIAVTIDFGPNNPGMREANASRIVACVNALVGWETETVEKYCTNGAPGNPNLGQKFDELHTQLKECQSARQREHELRVKLGGECEELKRQREKLLEAIEGVATTLGFDWLREEFDQIRDAVEEAKGGAL